MTDFQGVILAAGHGSRMGPFGERVPKPIVSICNRPLLAYQLDYMRQLGIEDVIIVIGHLGHEIARTMGDGSDYGVRIRYVEQERRLGIAHAVGQLEPYIDRPFLLFLGDIFFELSSLDPMVEAFQGETVTVMAVKEETDPDAVRRNFAVVLNEDKTVRRVIEKPRQAPTMLKGCGLYLFDLAVFNAIRRTPRTALRDEYEITDSIQIVIDDELPVRVAPIVEWDMNVTFLEDLITCCRRVLARTGQTAMVGKNCSLADGVELYETVIGDDVTIAHPIRLDRCVVLSGVVINDKNDYADTVFTGD